MPDYLLMIRRSGSIAYMETATSKHHFQAADLDHAKAEADVAVHNHYDGKIDKAAEVKLYDETDLVAMRTGNGPWEP
jgi:hypothetical protein